MTDSIFLSMVLNIGLLVLIATVLTKLPVVRTLLLDEAHSVAGRISLSVIFGVVSILSTYTGTNVQGAIVNTRVIGVLAAGLLGGPSVGIGTAAIAGIHRYLFDIGGFTAVSCALSTFAEGMLGAFFSRYFRRGQWDNIGIFFLTAASEVIQMLIILFIAKPFADALLLVKTIAAPMILLNSLGMVIFIATFNVVFMEEDNEYSHRIHQAFQVAEQSLSHLRKGLRSLEHMEETAKLIFQSSRCSCIMITNTTRIIASVSAPKEAALFSLHQIPQPALDAMEQKTVTLTTTSERDSRLSPILKNHVLIAAPLIELEQPVGCLIMASKRQWHSPNSNVTFLKELALLFSTQLELADLDYQHRLRKKAEYRALQSQINPHFLYNALNTIASVCRENPDRARELLRTLASYYRQALENERYMVSLATELYHVMNYLELEKARFEEKLQVEILIPEELHCMVPSFILQPLVENAIRHGADSNGNRYVCIRAGQEKEGIRIEVMDHGCGFDRLAIERLYSEEKKERGIGLGNVHKRLKSIYGESGGLCICNLEQGASVSFLITPSPTADLLADEDDNPI